MNHTIENTITADELSLFAEMPANMPNNHYNLKQTGKGILAVVTAGAIAYAGNKAINYFNNNENNAPLEDPNNDIAWE